MTIDIGNGKKDILRIRDNDVPFDLAYQFCVRHNLNMKIVDILAENKKNNMDVARSKNNNEQQEEREDFLGQEETQRDEEKKADSFSHLSENRENAVTKSNFYGYQKQPDHRLHSESDFVHNNEYIYRSDGAVGNPAQMLKVEQSKRDTHKDSSRSKKSSNYNEEPGPSAHRLSMRNRNGLYM